MDLRPDPRPSARVRRRAAPQRHHAARPADRASTRCVRLRRDGRSGGRGPASADRLPAGPGSRWTRAVRLRRSRPSHRGVRLCPPRARAADRRAGAPHWDLDEAAARREVAPESRQDAFPAGAVSRCDVRRRPRHPIAVSLATQKWSRTSLSSLLEHWLVCHRTFAGDRPHSARFTSLRYEDLVDDPAACLDRVFGFLAIEPHRTSEHLRSDSNAAYFAQWRELGKEPFGRLKPAARVRPASSAGWPLWLQPRGPVDRRPGNTSPRRAHNGFENVNGC